MKDILRIIYILAGSSVIYLIIYFFIRRIQDYKARIIKFSLFPLLLLIFTIISSNFDFLGPRYNRIIIFISSYTFIFLLILSITINVRDRKITFKNIIFSGIPVITIAFLHRLGFILPIINFMRNPIAEIGGVELTIANIIIAIGIFYISVRYSQTIKNILEARLSRIPSMDTARTNLIGMIVRYGILVIGIFIAFSIVGFDLTTLKVLIGALGVGIGFGLQNIVNNLISGFIILSDKSIVPEDLIEVDGLLGWVESVGLRASIIKTFNNVEIIVPNTLLVNNKLTNYTHTDNLIRIDVPVGVSYSSDPINIRELLVDSLSDMDDILEEPPVSVLFTNFGDSSLDFEVLLWTDEPTHKKKIESEARFLIWKVFKENNIEIPFPQRDVYIKEKNNEGKKGYSKK